MDVVIIGAGFAGAATAYHLARRGVERILLVEMEAMAGLHSSGRNAAMVRQVTADEPVAELARKGAAFIRGLADELRRADTADLFRRCGSLLLASGARVAPLEEDIRRGAAAGLEVERLERRDALARMPFLRDAPFELASFCASDGVVDVAALLRWYIDSARHEGAEVLFERRVTEIAVADGTIRGVRTADGFRETPVIVNAAGGWAQQIGRMARASEPPLRPTRRHLFVTGPLDWVSPEWPFVWDVSREVYFRPEAGGLLLSACDVGEPGANLGSDDVSREVLELLATKVTRSFPALEEITIRHGWSGIRTLTPDGRFVIGPDPEIEGFHWVAGLGGHGVTTSAVVGALCAELIESPQRDEANPHSPARFARSAPSPARRSESTAVD